MQILIVSKKVLAIYSDGQLFNLGELQSASTYSLKWLPNGFRYKKPIEETMLDVYTGKFIVVKRYCIKPGDIDPYVNKEASGIDAFWIKKYNEGLRKFYYPDLTKLAKAISSCDEAAVEGFLNELQSIDDKISALVNT